MRILFVVGPAFSGKSIYIRKEYPNATVVNISTFNKYAKAAESNEELETIAMNAQLYCTEELRQRIQCAKEDDVIILEHQLLKKEGRAHYLQAVREVTDTPVECIVLDTDEENVQKVTSREHPLISFHLYEKGKLQMPSTEEGFASVTVVHPVFTEEDLKN